MDISFDSEELVQAILEDETALDALTEAIKDRIDISGEVRDAFDYHDDKFRVSWMRMMEAESEDLRATSRDSACNHGQKVLDGLFNAMKQYLISNVDEAKQLLGLDNLPQTIQEVARAAATAAATERIKPVWQGSGYTVDARPSMAAGITATIGEPVPAYVSPAHTDDDVEREFTTGDTVICDQGNEPHGWGPSCTNPVLAELSYTDD